MKKGYTQRGFAIVTFKDRYDQKCSLQESSLTAEDLIWFGVNNTGPDLPGPSGAVNEDVNARMHLTREQVKELLPYLKKFVRKGEF